MMALFGSDRMFQFGSEDDVLHALRGRPYWDQIRQEVLRALIGNARGDNLKISRFVYVSEYYDCVKKNFVDLAGIWEDPRLALSAFAATLLGLAVDTIRHLGEVPVGSEQQVQATVLVEMIYLSVLLCDPYMLNACRKLASFYQAIGKTDNARAMCRKYDETEQALLNATDDYTREYRRTKYEPSASGMRVEIDRLKAQLG
jgi:hypothetical protein